MTDERKRRKRVAVVTSGYLPVPNVLGGAVEALDMVMARENEKTPRFDFTVFSAWADGVDEAARGFTHTEFDFVHAPWFVRAADRCVYALAKYVLHKPKLMSYRYIVQRLWYIRHVAAQLAKRDFDAVMIENHATLFMTMQKHGNMDKYAGKVYYHLHNEVTNDFGCKSEIARVRKVFGVSHYIVGTLDAFLAKANGKGLEPEQKSVWRNCVDITRFNPADGSVQAGGKAFRGKLGIPEDATVFLFSGRLTPEKGARELLEAFVTADIDNAYLVIAGAFFFNSNIVSPFERELHELAKQAGDRIKFTGFVDYKDMPSVYAMADVCCLPSIWDDPAPLAVIESLASGRALITTRSGGIPEYADDKAAVILERDGDLTANLADAMRDFAADPQKRAAYGAHGRELAERLSTAAYLNQLVELMGE
ncbi:glycosyltransferase family 4 protein [Bifidobacterium aesculapii]|uniref:glycosyltransferase family 4 protein n=1 Tax=Bifidobacterium aesculapii TaxID=1329411 RepID=UPI0006E43A8D|nr:glycosyltransferase family 4 protein [Bifidobacterium aesculapii]